MATPDQVLERLSRTTEQILGRDDLCDRLASGRPLRIKFGVDARNAKLDLAEAIVARHHGSADATQARRAFVDVFSERGLPTQMPRLEVAPHATVVQLVNAARPELTRSAARRLIAEGAVRINGVKRVDSEEPAHVNAGDVLQAGRRRWFTLAVGSDLN